MKKLLFILCLLAFIVGFGSCEKEYTCTCTTTDTSGVFKPSTSQPVIIPSSKKSDAEEICASSGNTFGTLETVCTLD